jgi:hypothetical protein
VQEKKRLTRALGNVVDGSALEVEEEVLYRKQPLVYVEPQLHDRALLLSTRLVVVSRTPSATTPRMTRNRGSQVWRWNQIRQTRLFL